MAKSDRPKYLRMNTMARREWRAIAGSDDGPDYSTALSTTDAIWEHWVVHLGVPTETARDMRTELTEHLADALADGKTIEQVVGSDLRSFADDWSASRTQPDTPIANAWIGLAGVAGLALALLSMEAVTQWTLRPIVSLSLLFFIAVLSSAIAGFLFSRRASPLPHGPEASNSPRHSLLVGGAGGVLLLGATSLFNKLGLDAWEISVDPRLTGLALVAAPLVILGPLVALLRPRRSQ